MTIAEPLKDTGVFPAMVTQMIAVGEKTGDLSGMLAKIAEFYTEEVDAAVESLTAVIEPIYDYRCGNCGWRHARRHVSTDIQHGRRHTVTI